MNPTAHEPSPDVLFYQRWGKRVYCSHMENANPCQERVIGQFHAGQYVFHYCNLHKEEQRSRAQAIS